MAIEWRGISTLIPYARNSRTHSEAQIAEIAGSIREFGFTNPVLIDPEGGIFGEFTSLPPSMIRPPSVQRAGSDATAVHRAQHLNVTDGIEAEARRRRVEGSGPGG